MTKEEWKEITGSEAEHLYTVECKAGTEKDFWELKTFDDLKAAKAHKAKQNKISAEFHQTGYWHYRIVDENKIICG